MRKKELMHLTRGVSGRFSSVPFFSQAESRPRVPVPADLGVLLVVTYYVVGLWVHRYLPTYYAKKSRRKFRSSDIPASPWLTYLYVPS